LRWAAVAANLLAVSRVLLIPPFILCIFYSQRDGSHLDLARALFLYGVVSDVLDGRLGKLAGNNPIGQFLDPLADKLCIAAVYLSLSLIWHNPPLWLTCVVVGRFLILRLLWLFGFLRAKEKLHSFLQKESALTKPNLWGKVSSWSQAILIVSILFSLPGGWIGFLYWAVAALTVAAGIIYLVRGVQEAKRLGLV